MAKAKKPSSKTITTAKPAQKTAGISGTKTVAKSADVSDKERESLTPQVQMTLNHDQVAKRAFAIWVAKGRPTGQDEQNWKEAEVLLTRDLAKRA